ncbi:MAG TPA: protein kinase [Mycobacteriales bacterium]|nr:protein kinase [Mycobacteriales bacterium]
MTAGLAEDRLLNDRYRLLDLIATGGMGEVWRARDEMLERDVAIKALKREYADDETFIARFQGEAKHTANLTHPGIATVFDYGEDAGTSYLVMELVEGEPLSAMIRREGRLDPLTTLTIVGQAALALHAAHAAGVIHRDIKPGNLLIAPDLTTKVTDFGIAWAAAAVPLTLTGTVLGTAHYLSPEQGTGADVTPASDVYSLGVVAYECLAGRRPFEGGSAVSIALAHVQDEPPPLPDDVPGDVRTLIEQALAKEPTERFTTAAAFARAVTATQQRLDGSLAPPLASAAAEPTAVIPLHDLPVAPGAPVLPPALTDRLRHRDGAYRPSRSALLTALGGAIVLVLIAAAIAASRPPERRTLPALAGLELAAAQQALDDLGFEHDVRRESNRSVRSGLIVTTDPVGPAELEEGSTVELVVSTGPAGVTLPGGLIGQPADAVVAALTRLGLRPTVVRVTTGRTTAGTVISITPGTGLREGAAVTVAVARAPVREDGGGGRGKDEDKGKDD